MSRRDEVLQAALDLLDEVGLDALTTRRLAERLGVQPGALYRHFDSKRALLGAMVERLIGADGELPEFDGDWAGLIRVLATGSRAAMLTRRDGARLVITNVSASGGSQRAWDFFRQAMRSAGLSDGEALLAIDTVFAYVNGFTIEEQTRDGFPQPGKQRALRDAAFQSGLDLIITGIRARIPDPAGG